MASSLNKLTGISSEIGYAMATTRTRIRKPKAGMDRERLRSELIALYHQYVSDADHAASLQHEYERMSKNVEVLLDEEFPDWKESGPAGPVAGAGG